MDNNGQLTFSDDSVLNESNNAYLLLEDGNFNDAVMRFDTLMSSNPDYPGVVDGYRTAKFWLNRSGELHLLPDGRETADFLMIQWGAYDEYATEKDMQSSSAYKAVMKFIFNAASEHYKRAFQEQEDPSGNLDLLLNLGYCFLRLREYRNVIGILENARSSYSADAMHLATLAEAYFHVDEKPRSLLLFREAFLVNPSGIDLSLIEALPVKQILDAITASGRQFQDVREWISVYGFVTDVFYVRKNLSRHQTDSLEREIYNLELSFQKLNRDQIDSTNVLPRLLTRYLWMYEFYEVQQYNFSNLVEIRDRLLALDRELFEEYFKNRLK